MLIVHLIYFHPQRLGNSYQLDELKKIMTDLVALDRQLSRNVVKIEFDLDSSALIFFKRYTSEVKRLRSTLQSFANIGEVDVQGVIKLYLKAIEEKRDAVGQYQDSIEAYKHSKQAFYSSRVKVYQQIDDESIENLYQVQAILDSVQRQVDFFLQHSDPNRKQNNIEFLRVSGVNLQKLAPELSSSIEPFLNRGISLIENKAARRESFEKILFDTDLSFAAAILNSSLVGEKTINNKLVILGLSFIFVLSGLMIYQGLNRSGGYLHKFTKK